MKAILTFIAFLSLGYCESGYLSVVEMDAEQQNAANLKTRRLRKQIVRKEAIWPGKIRNSSQNLVEIAAPTEGVLYPSDHVRGQSIDKGMELALLDPAIVEEYHDIESELTEAIIMAKRESEEVDRLKSLSRDGSVSKKDIQDALARQKVLNKKVEILEEHLDWLSEGGQLLQTAPIRIVSAKQGILEFVPQARQKWVQRGELLYSIRSPGAFEVAIDLYPSIYNQVGNIDSLSLNGLDLTSLRLESGTPPPLVANLQSKESGLVSGASVSVKALMREPKPILCLNPQELIREGSDGLVFLDIGEGHFGLRKVVLGLETSECIEVSEGVESGDFIVSEGVWQLYLLARGTQGGDHSGHSH